MICCDVQLQCGRCKQDKLVHLERINAKETGFGCLFCGTAVKKGDKYFKNEESE